MILETIREQTLYLDQRAKQTGYRIDLSVFSGGARLRICNLSTGAWAESPVADVCDFSGFKLLVDNAISGMVR